MSTGYGYTHPRLPKADLRRLMTSLCGAPKDPIFLYNQAIDTVSLTRLEEGEPTLAPEGRAFGPEAEVRWQRCEDDDRDNNEGDDQDETEVYTVLMLNETALNLGSGWEVETFEVCDQLDDEQPLVIYLMGVWQPDEQAWIEVRIPHLLDYPLDDPGQMARPVAPAVEYSRDGIVRHIRFKGLKSEPLEEAQR
jgi:hypothetical protein